jgi:NADH:ubiquinone oxidoreductase subunit E
MDVLKGRVKELVQKHGKARENLLPVLQGIAACEQYVSEYAMKLIAEEMELSSADVYGTATFYSFMDTTPKGKFVIRVCRTI